ncbi:MAG: type 1 glutamine amidotransferase domain-containing protein [Gammaproteobacteria bacterium]|jgi:putative intracellular protease/amidase
MTSDGDKRVLFVVTSHGQLGDTGKPTGYFLPEVSHPHRILVNKGCTIDFVSPEGGSPPMDPVSAEAMDDISRAFLAHESWRASLDNSLRPDQVDPDRYDGVFYAGGHGTMWDFPDNEPLAEIASSIYTRGGVVAAVCHGPAGLVNVRIGDEYLANGRTMACFTNQEETAVALADVVPFLLEDRLRERGAIIIPAAPFQPQVVTSGRVVTGQNPASAEGVGLAMVKLLGT